VRLLHSLARTHASFDDPNLVSHSGLVPVMALAQRAGLADLVAEHVRPGGECGVNAELKVPCLIAGMAAGADSIDDMGPTAGPGPSLQLTGQADFWHPTGIVADVADHR